MKLAEIERQLVGRLSIHKKCVLLDAVINDKVPLDNLSK